MDAVAPNQAHAASGAATAPAGLAHVGDATAGYASVAHTAHGRAGGELSAVVHVPQLPNQDTHHAAADVTAQAAQAIAASASSYTGIPAGGIPAVDPAYAVGYAAERPNAHAAYANAAAAAHHATSGMEYIAFAASAAAHQGAEHSIAAASRGASPTTGSQAPSAASVQAQGPQNTTGQSTLPDSTEWMSQSSSSRHAMDVLLQEQRQAIFNVSSAEEEILRAQERLAEAKQRKENVDKRVTAHAETLMDDLLAEPTRWNEMYNRLVEFKRQNGHCHVMRNPASNRKPASSRRKLTREKDELRSLGAWVGQNRLDARRPLGHPELLEPYKKIALDKLGFDWEPRENYWQDMYEQLKTYLEQNGGKMPPRYKNNTKFPLGQWCDTQLDNYRKFNSGKKGAYITQEKIELLNQIGFIWDKRGQLWRENYDRLRAFQQENGHCNATASNNGGDKSFGTWVTKQKRKYASWRNGETKSLEYSLSEEQAALMDAIGFGECVDVDGRKMRGGGRSTSGGPPRKAARTIGIAGLVNASAELDAGQVRSSENANANAGPPETVANSWGDSANAVSLLVDAIMNKEGHTAPSNPAKGAVEKSAVDSGMNVSEV